MDKELNEYYAKWIKRMRSVGKECKQEPFVRVNRIKRNEKCSCDSGLKYKRCCMLKEA